MNKHYAFCAGALLLMLLSLLQQTDLTPPGRPYRVTESHGVQHAHRLERQALPPEGEPWNSDYTAIFAEDSHLVLDLGIQMHIGALAIQADNNDEYLIESSTDGKHFTPLWKVPAVEGFSLRLRTNPELDTTAQYLRLSPRAGDGSMSVSYLSAYKSGSVMEASLGLRKKRALTPSQQFETGLMDLVFFAVLAGFVLGAGAQPVHRLTAGVLLAYGLFSAGSGYLLLDAASPQDKAFTRAAAALLALCVLVRGRLLRRTWPALPRVQQALLGLAALLGVAGFYNLGHPQFWHAREARPTFIHAWDMVQYYLGVKYHAELGYNGLYDAGATAYRQNHPDEPDILPDSQPIRDLATLNMQPLSARAQKLEQARQRFTDARWSAFRADLAFFEGVLGEEVYKEVMLGDFGHISPPSAMLMVYPLYAFLPASEKALTATGLLDALWLGAGLLAIFWAFGLELALLCAVLLGANDYYIFGNSWVGSTLRHDWLAYMMLSAALLRRHYWLAGGMVLALAAMTRAFPALMLLGLVLMFLWRAPALRGQRLSLPLLLRHFWPLPRILLGVVCMSALLFVGSSLLFGLEAWFAWFARAHTLDETLRTNVISLHSLLIGAVAPYTAQRLWLPYAGCVVLALALVGLACRRQPPFRAALLGLLLVPVLFAPGSYYLHFICLLPLLLAGAGGWPRLAGQLGLLGLCFLQYASSQLEVVEIRFSILQMQWLLLTLLLLACVIWENERRMKFKLLK